MNQIEEFFEHVSLRLCQRPRTLIASFVVDGAHFHADANTDQSRGWSSVLPMVFTGVAFKSVLELFSTCKELHVGYEGGARRKKLRRLTISRIRKRAF